MSLSLAGGLPALTLILGGARSGKSRYAETLVMGAAASGTYIATAVAGDAEMAARIEEHRRRRNHSGRGEFWHTVEESLGLAGARSSGASTVRQKLPPPLFRRVRCAAMRAAISSSPGSAVAM